MTDDSDLSAYEGFTLVNYKDRPITRRAIWRAALHFWFRIHILRKPRPETLYLSVSDQVSELGVYSYDTKAIEFRATMPKPVGKLGDLPEGEEE